MTPARLPRAQAQANRGYAIMILMPRKSRAKTGLSRAEILERARAAKANALQAGEETRFMHLRASAAAIAWFSTLEPKARQTIIEAAYKRAKREPKP